MNANSTKRPQYVILFLDVPTLIYFGADLYASVSHNLRTNLPGWSPFVTHIHMGDTNACKAFIDKLEYFGTIYSPGKLIISANAGGYGNTNFYFDENVPSNDVAKRARDAAFAVGVDSSAVFYDGTTNIIGNGSNVVGYISWGSHAGMGGDYARDGQVVFSGDSSWFLIETVESWNGQRLEINQGNFLDWFSANAFGGTNYAHTPIGAVSHLFEPGTGGVNRPDYFSR